MGKIEPKATARPYDHIGLTPGRTGEKHHLANPGIIISADNHIALGNSDFFYDNAPSKLKNRVPRVLFDEKKGHWVTHLHGKSLWPFGSDALVKGMEGRPGSWDIDLHVADMDAEGIDAGMSFPNLIPSLFKAKDYDMREYVMFEYNKYLADFQRRHPGRFYGVGMPNFWDPANASGWIKQMKADGFKVVMMPLHPGDYLNGEEIIYSAPEFEPMWQALAENDLAVAYHIGENHGHAGYAGFESAALGAMGGLSFRHVWGRLTMGGVFEKFPTLRVAFAEANLHWVPGMLQDADMMTEAMSPLFQRLKMRPSEYWYRNCYATFMHDEAGLRLIDKVGVNNALWSSDYPHPEGTFGYTGAALQQIVDLVGDETGRKLYGANAKKFLNI